MLKFSSVQRRKILKEAGFLPYMGGKNPINPITPEPIAAGAMGQDTGLDSQLPETDQVDDSTDQEDILDKIVALLKLVVGEDHTEEEIRIEAQKILRLSGI